MKATSTTRFSLWRRESLFNIDFAFYSLTNHQFPRHFHDHFVIELVMNGIDSFYCNGKNYTANSDQLVLINPGEVHTGDTLPEVPLDYFSFYPDNTALKAIASALNITLPENFCFERTLVDSASAGRTLRMLFESLRSNASQLRQQELFFECMSQLLKPTTDYHLAHSPTQDKRVQLVIDFMRSKFAEDISLDHLASIASLNPFHLVRLFKKTIGLSPYDYLLIIRAEKAKQLLRAGARVQEAASDTGFYDSSHLNRTFYKVAGTSPRSFRSSKSQYCTRLAV